MGLVGLVGVLSANGFAKMQLLEIGVVTSCGRAEYRSNPHAFGLLLYGHTYLSRAHATVQCMTMCKGTVDGNKFAKGFHAKCHVTIATHTPLSPSHSMLKEYAGTEREGLRTT